MSDRRNELTSDLLTTTSLQPWPGNISASRLQMFNSHITQALVVKDATDRRCFTGMEAKFGEYNFAVKLHDDAHVLKVVQRYPRTLTAQGIKVNPETVVIFERERETASGRKVMELDYISKPTHHTLHQSFGFEYKEGEPLRDHMGKDSVLAQSPSISPEGNYRYGLEANVAMMSVPQIIEDGMVVSKSFCKRMETLAMETHVVSWGKKRFPLNMYGDDEHYKVFPDIGETVGEHGILVALGDYDELMAPIAMTNDALKKPDFKYDQSLYVEPGAKVIDVKIHHDTRVRNVRNVTSVTSEAMREQTEKYLTAQKLFYQNIYSFYQDMHRQRRGALRISPAFHRLLVEAQLHLAKDDKLKMIRTYRTAPIDEWRVEITISYPLIPDVGFKLSDTAGGKGVIVEVMDDEDMPIDAAGNRAELIVDGISTIKRMNVSRLFEQYINACSREVELVIRNMVQTNEPKEVINNYLMGYYNLVNPDMAELVSVEGIVTDAHLQSVLTKGIHLWIPSENQREPLDTIKQLMKHYPPVFGPVTYRGVDGNLVTTKENVLIGSMYILLLEKTGRDWSGVASSKLSHFGIPAKLTSVDRNLAPMRIQPIRFGESEFRLFCATMGGQAAADLLDRTNNPVKRKYIQETLLRSEQPTNIKQLIDPVKMPSGQGNILGLIRNFVECSGWVFKQGE